MCTGARPTGKPRAELPGGYVRVVRCRTADGSRARQDSAGAYLLSRIAMTALTRPDPSEHAPFYGRYVGLVPDGAAARHAPRAARCLGAACSRTPTRPRRTRRANGPSGRCSRTLPTPSASLPFGCCGSRAAASAAAGFDQDAWAGTAPSLSVADGVAAFRTARAATVRSPRRSAPSRGRAQASRAATRCRLGPPPSFLPGTRSPTRPSCATAMG